MFIWDISLWWNKSLLRGMEMIKKDRDFTITLLSYGRNAETILLQRLSCVAFSIENCFALQMYGITLDQNEGHA